MLVDVVATFSGPSHSIAPKPPLHCNSAPKGHFTSSMTRAVPPRFSSCVSGGDGGHYSV